MISHVEPPRLARPSSSLLVRRRSRRSLAQPGAKPRPMATPTSSPTRRRRPRRRLAGEGVPGKPQPEVGADARSPSSAARSSDGSDGWFGPAEIAVHLGVARRARTARREGEGASRRTSSAGPPACSTALDRDGDGKHHRRRPRLVRPQPLRPCRRPAQPPVPPDGRQRRRQADPRGARRRSSSGSAKGKDHFTADDLRRAMIPPRPAGFCPGDGPIDPRCWSAACSPARSARSSEGPKRRRRRPRTSR